MAPMSGEIFILFVLQKIMSCLKAALTVLVAEKHNWCNQALGVKVMFGILFLD